MKRKIEIPIGPSIALVPLTKGQHAIIEIADIPLIENFSWMARFDPKLGVFYANSYSHRRMSILHRVILGAPSDKEVDHKNGEPLDNRRSNLRLSTRHQNSMNHKINKNNTSGFKGVSWHSQARKWRAYIALNYRQIGLGLFNCPKEAHAAYMAAAQKHCGEFARSA